LVIFGKAGEMVDLVAVSMSIFVGKAPSNPNTAPIVEIK
jgi:hypothetical protein